ncbi:MAG: LysE family transporter [Anaerolineales bacterium]|nr:LysE family transporter [Anaerolineales bacterium]
MMMNLFLALGSLFTIWWLVLMIPGPNFVVVSQLAISDSRKSGVLSTLGVSTGAATWATGSLIGLSAVFGYASWIYDSIKFLGGLYLIYLGFRVILTSFQEMKIPKYTNKLVENQPNSYRCGLFASFSNPKTATFFGSLFVMSFPSGAPAWFYLVTIIMVFLASTIWYSLVAYLFSTTQFQSRYDRFRKTLDKLTGSVLVILGIRLAFSRS